MSESQPSCISCGKDSQSVPLIAFVFKGETHYICPQDLPVLIHQPARLAKHLPGAEALKPSSGHGH